MDFNTGEVKGWCLHRKHTRSVGEAVYKARNCKRCRHFIRKNANKENKLQEIQQDPML